MYCAFPDLRELLVDTHVHSKYSDGTAGVPRIEHYCRDRGMGVALTDHNEIRGSTALCERQRLPVLPGIEVGTQEGVDLLVYFPTPEALEEFYIKAIEPFLRSRFMSRSWVQTTNCLGAAREMGGYISLAHPFAIGRKSLNFQTGRRGKPFVQTLLDGIDAIELHNGSIPKHANRKARAYCETAGKRFTVGSDSHRLRTIGSSGTYLATPTGNTSTHLFQAITTGDDLHFKVKSTFAAGHLPLLGIVALKHTHHFMRPTYRRPRR
jgi:predicted metal-dependent phosphoesterase TrpH